MKLVIDIPKEMIEAAKTDLWCGNPTVGYAIKRGTPYEERLHGEWIPCSERLPEKNGRYLASWVSNLTNRYNIDSIFFAYGEWDCCNGDVEAWMPLPDPWRKEE